MHLQLFIRKYFHEITTDLYDNDQNKLQPLAQTEQESFNIGL